MNLHLFSLIIAWPIAVICSGWFLLCLIATIQYHASVEARLDALRGRQKSWPLFKPAIFALISWAWIIAI